MKIVFIFILSCFLFTACKKSSRQVSEIIVAKVGPYELTSKDFASQLALKLKNFDALTAKSSKNVSRIKKNIFDQFVLRSITLIWAEKNGLKISQEEIDAEIARIRSTYPNDLAFRRNLAKEHISFDHWKSEIQFNFLQKKLSQKLREGWKSPEESVMKKFYEKKKSLFKRENQIKVRQIVTEREDKAKLFQKKLRKGKSLSELSQYSSGPEKKSQGKTGWIDINTLGVFKRAFQMPVGSRTPILKSPFGYHIIEVLGKRKGGYIPFEKAKERVRQQILEENEQKLYSEWLDNQLRQQNIYKNEKVISSISVVTKEN